MHGVHVLRAVPQSIELKENAEKSMEKNEKYVEKKYGDKIITHYNVETTSKWIMCMLASHTHTFISTSVAVLCKL